MASLPAKGEPSALYLLDLPGLARAVLHIARPAMTPGGEPSAVTAGVIGGLARLLRRQDPRYLAFCTDLGRSTFRHELYPDYRRGHAPDSPEYLVQLDRVREILALHRIPILQAEGFSTGDLLASACARARAAGLDVVLLSKSQEIWQLVRDGEVVVWDGRSDLATGEAEVRAAFHGVAPAQLPDLFALAGRGDEAPGVPGVGEKTAARLLLRHGSLDEVLRKWQWEKGKLGLALRDHAGAARLSLSLVSLRSDAPIDVDLAELAVGGYDAEALRRVYDELGLLRLRDEVQPIDKPTVPDDLRSRWAGWA
ncbi:MAG: 5'-3' exonuclease H3TH domain-containing protein [Byssovorax sp.]